MSVAEMVETAPLVKGNRKVLNRLREQLQTAFVERDAEIELILLGMIARKHCMFVGPPGTAKSQLLRFACAAIEDANFFEYMMMKDTDRNELLGYIDMAKVQKEHKWERMMEDQLPTAHYVFLDEFMRSSSFAANILLRAMNEGELIDMGKKLKLPMRMAVVGGNDWPIGEGFQEWAAIFDRFLIRRQVKPVSHTGRARLAFDVLPPVMPCCSLHDLDAASEEAAMLPISSAAMDTFMTILDKLSAEGIRPGDRRVRQSVSVCKAAAYLDEADEVGVPHLECLVDILWEDPINHPKKAAEVIMPLANPTGHEITSLYVEIDDTLKNSTKDLPAAATALRKLESALKKAEILCKTDKKKGDKIVAYIKAEQVKLAGKLSGGILSK